MGDVTVPISFVQKARIGGSQIVGVFFLEMFYSLSKHLLRSLLLILRGENAIATKRETNRINHKTKTKKNKKKQQQLPRTKKG